MESAHGRSCTATGHHFAPIPVTGGRLPGDWAWGAVQRSKPGSRGHCHEGCRREALFGTEHAAAAGVLHTYCFVCDLCRTQWHRRRWPPDAVVHVDPTAVAIVCTRCVLITEGDLWVVGGVGRARRPSSATGSCCGSGRRRKTLFFRECARGPGRVLRTGQGQVVREEWPGDSKIAPREGGGEKDRWRRGGGWRSRAFVLRAPLS